MKIPDSDQSMKIQSHEARASRHLPFTYLTDQNIVRTKSGDYVVVLKIEGLSCETLEDHELNFEQSLRAKLFSTIADPRFAIYHTIIRSRINELSKAHYQNDLAEQLQNDYNQALTQHALFQNDLYLTLILKGSGSRGNRIISRMNQWLTGLSHQLAKKQSEEADQVAIKLINETVLRFESALSKYKIRKLGTYSTQHGEFSETIEFFSQIFNWENSPCSIKPRSIAEYLPRRHLFIGNKAIESQGNLANDSKFAAILSLKEYPSTTFPGMLDYLLQLPIEMVVTQSFALQQRQDSREALELQLRRLRQAHDPDQKGIQALEQALGDLVAGEFGFGYHHFTLMLIAPTLDLLETYLADADKRLRECGIVAIRERLNLEACFWAQFPSNFRYLVRKLPITTNNFASLCSLTNDPSGQATGNHWGEAVTVLKTSSNLPYYFNFHPKKSDVGHTLIVGMTGSGKTLLTTFLLASSLKFNPRIFYFDKDHGAETFMRGIGSAYSKLGSGADAGLNPLQLPDTPNNRHFLVDWLRSLVIAHGEELNAADMEIIHNAVRLNYEKLKNEQRTLANLADAFGRGGPGTLRNRFDQWHSNGPFASYFGSTTDRLHLDNNYYCFEMGHLLDKSQELVRPSVLLYLFYRIQLALDENPQHQPTIICLDEADQW